jgi:hypothetical protein
MVLDLNGYNGMQEQLMAAGYVLLWQLIQTDV